MKATRPPTALDSMGSVALTVSWVKGKGQGMVLMDQEHTPLCQERVLGGGVRKDSQKAVGARGAGKALGGSVEVLVSFPRTPFPVWF